MRSTVRRRRGLQAAGALLIVLFTAACGAASKSYREGLEQAEVGDHDRAVISFSKALAESPGNVRYRMALQKARFRAALGHFDKGKKYLAAGRYDLAVGELQAATFLDPSNDYAAIELQKASELLVAQQNADTTAQTMDEMKKRARQSLDPPKLNPSSNVPIVLKFKDEELGRIFDALSKASGINFLYDDRVELNKRISVDQSGISFEQALDLLMIQNKLFYKVHNESTLILIPDNRQKRQEYADQVIKTFYLSNAEVKDVQSVLRTLLDARKVAVNDQLNAITIKDTPDVVAVAERLVDGNDKAKSEVVVDVEIIEVNRSTFQQLGIDITTSVLGLTFNGGEAAGSGRVLRLGSLNEINNKAAWTLGPVPGVILNFLKTDSDTKIIAKPQVRVTEGERAQLNIGQRVPIPTTSFNTSNTVGGSIVPLTSFTYQNVGISVEVEPRVHHNREITLNTAFEVSALAGTIQTTGGSSQPIIGTRNITSVIRLKEGETQLIAGLIQETDRNSVRTIPGFDKIPILRSIFGTHVDEVERTDIILMLTPRIVRLPNIREEDLQALWVGTETNVVLQGAERSPFGDGPFEAPEEPGGTMPPPVLAPGSGAAGEEGGPAPETDQQTRDTEAEQDTPTQAVVLSMVPIPPNPAVGQQFDVQVRIFNAVNVVSTPFRLRFDSLHLRYVPEGAVQGPFLGSGGGNVSFLAGSTSPGDVAVGLSLLGAASGVDGSGILCTLRFEVLTPGLTSLVPYANQVFGPGLQQLPYVFQSIGIEVPGEESP